MYDRGKIVTGIVIGLALFLFPFYYNAGGAKKAPEPVLTDKAKEAKLCIEPKEYMRTNHMKVLDTWREDVVRTAQRTTQSADNKTYLMSLQSTCMDCHSNKTKFCDQCHNYLGVAPYCWDCHIAPKENN
jgi:hypothetical protein